MVNRTQPGPDARAQRKAQLVAQGAAYRVMIRAAQSSVKTELSADELAKSALSHVASAAYAAFKSRTGIAGLTVQTLLPLVVGGVSALSKRALFKPVMRGALLLGVAATAVAFVAKKRKAGKKQRESGAGRDRARES